MDKGKLVAKIEKANIIKDFVSHAGYRILKEKIEEKISDSKHSWLKAKDKEQAEAIRLKAGAYQDVYDIITRLVLEGIQAGELINKIDEQEKRT
jgi:hypothetical protein